MHMMEVSGLFRLVGKFCEWGTMDNVVEKVG